MRDFWNQRFANPEYAYGKEPNTFFKEVLALHKPGRRILFPAEGEGRNAVYAAGLGYQVTAFDISEEGRKKALQLAKDKDVEIEYLLGSVDELNLEDGSFDAVVLIFAHVAPEMRQANHRSIARLLKPGGLLFLEGFSKQQIHINRRNARAGGPRNEEMLFSEEELLSDFQGFEFISLEETVTDLREGPFHQGEGAVIRLVARKKLPQTG